jgi:peptidoglycan hydrolase-like protein with peptidoglycan-binding domain
VRRALLAGGAAVVLAAGGAAAGALGAGPAGTATAGDTDPTSLATVTRGTLSAQVQVPATLGYAGSYSLVNQGSGIYTWLPAPGQVIGRGQVLYRVSGSPVVLLYGTVPAYRPLSEGMTGADVRQLNANLAALGYGVSPVSVYFTAQTAHALELFQSRLGVARTGVLALGQVLFLPTAARVTAVSGTLGDQAGPGQLVLQASSTQRQVSIALDAAEQSYVRAGDRVVITLPDGQATPGVVTMVGSVATAPASSVPGGTSTPTVNVEVAPADPAGTGNLDQAPVEVSITAASISGVLIVPVDALLALADGGYAIEVAPPGGGAHRLLPVSLGIFDDAAGTVQVEGTGLHAGQRVVVPGL